MSSKTALLHIGTQKTGTTSLQAYLANAEKSGALGPYCYPIYRGVPNHNRLTTLYLPHAKQPPSTRIAFPHDDNRYQRAWRRYRKFLFGALRSSAGSVMSAEVLCNAMSTQSATQLRHDLESLGFNKFHIVMYVRDPADFYLSRTQTQLKSPKHPRPPVIDPTSFRYRFLDIADTWERAFPGELTVRHYSSGSRFDVVADFTDVLQQSVGITIPPSSSELRLNSTVSAEGMVLLQRYRETVGTDESGLRFPGLDGLAAFLSRSGQRITQTRPRLKTDVAEEIRANHQHDAEHLSSRYGVDLTIRSRTVPLRGSSVWRVEDILESVDQDIVHHLWAEFQSSGPELKRPLPVRAAARAYLAIPEAFRPELLDTALRSRAARWT